MFMYRIVEVDEDTYNDAVSETLHETGSDVEETIAYSVEIPEGRIEAVMAIVSPSTRDWRKLFTIIKED